MDSKKYKKKHKQEVCRHHKNKGMKLALLFQTPKHTRNL